MRIGGHLLKSGSQVTIGSADLEQFSLPVCSPPASGAPILASGKIAALYLVRDGLHRACLCMAGVFPDCGYAELVGLGYHSQRPKQRHPVFLALQTLASHTTAAVEVPQAMLSIFERRIVGREEPRLTRSTDLKLIPSLQWRLSPQFVHSSRNRWPLPFTAPCHAKLICPRDCGSRLGPLHKAAPLFCSFIPTSAR